MNGEKLQLLQAARADGAATSIAYRFRKPEGNRPVFVWFCGYKSDMAGLKAHRLSCFAAGAQAGCLRFDYSGHGRSGGRFVDGTIGAWLDEAAAVCDAALSASNPVVFVGSSMGGWIALLLAKRWAEAGRALPKGVVLIAPAWDMTRLFRERLPAEAREAIERDGVIYIPSQYSDDPTPITKAILDDGENHLLGAGPVALDAPIRILHGREDPDVPWRRSLELLDVVASPDIRLTLIKDGDHRLSRPQDLELLLAALDEFL
jgi:pimeloyl-ACP methyl ester carboxylesterase